MKDRCKPDSRSATWYDDRGIAVDPKFINDFLAFLAEVGRRPGPTFSLDRINNDLGYVPGNLQWATKKEQGWNRRPTKFYRAFGYEFCIKDWGRVTGLKSQRIYDYVNKGYPIERILPLPSAWENPQLAIDLTKQRLGENVQVLDPRYWNSAMLKSA